MKVITERAKSTIKQWNISCRGNDRRKYFQISGSEFYIVDITDLGHEPLKRRAQPEEEDWEEQEI